jgi:hypothetical protein
MGQIDAFFGDEVVNQVSCAIFTVKQYRRETSNHTWQTLLE